VVRIGLVPASQIRTTDDIPRRSRHVAALRGLSRALLGLERPLSGRAQPEWQPYAAQVSRRPRRPLSPILIFIAEGVCCGSGEYSVISARQLASPVRRSYFFE